MFRLEFYLIFIFPYPINPAKYHFHFFINYQSFTMNLFLLMYLQDLLNYIDVLRYLFMFALRYEVLYYLLNLIFFNFIAL
jgi:hypothetical protein